MRSNEDIRRLYRTARWRKLREAQLGQQPLCVMCQAMDIAEVATVVHHAEGGHRNDPDRFWGGPLVSLCAAHHDREGKLEDRGRMVVCFGPDGWPL